MLLRDRVAEVGVRFVEQEGGLSVGDDALEGGGAHVDGVHWTETTSASTSRVRGLPEPFSGERSASRGIDSNASSAWQWAIQSATAWRGLGRRVESADVTHNPLAVFVQDRYLMSAGDSLAKRCAPHW